tara:strand:- start:776 stop:901 length:126 start_codon:yes stop_codon:yes gene_type:complete
MGYVLIEQVYYYLPYLFFEKIKKYGIKKDHPLYENGLNGKN